VSLTVARHRVAGSPRTIAGTVYGTIVVMATLAAGGGGDPALDAWHLAVLVGATVVVLWLAHVYAHGLAESIQLERRLDLPELSAVARRELAIVLAAVPPVVALVLGAAGVLRESRAIWLALVLCLMALLVQGVRYARLEHLSRFGTFVAVTVNLVLGLVIVALKAALLH
jgi:hypothetical protein